MHMLMPAFVLALAITVSPVATPATAAGAQCDIAATENIADLNRLLSDRAIEIIRRANAAGWKTDARLQALLAPEVDFALGSGDVGRPMGSGAAGAHALASDMRADSFRYFAWSSIPRSVDACAEHKVKVDFIRTQAAELDTVEFTFRAGLLVSAKGWSHRFVGGPMIAAKR